MAVQGSPRVSLTKKLGKPVKQRSPQCLILPFGSEKPKTIVNAITTATELSKQQWPMSLLRRIWDALIQRDAGRRKSAAHEARWLNLLGYSLRPGYGVALG